MSRYLQRPEPKPERPTKGQSYNVCVVGDVKTERASKSQTYSVCLVNGRTVRDHTGVAGGCGSPCNPSTCDFWPHCSHRQNVSLDTQSKSKFENVDIDGYVSVRRSGSQHRGKSPRSQSPHSGVSPQNRSPHANVSPQEQPPRSPDREPVLPPMDPWRLAPGEGRLRSGASTPVSSARSPPTQERLRRSGTPESVPLAAAPSGTAPQKNWDHLRSLSLPKSFLSHRATGTRTVNSR